jgi:phosphate/sulfate permease
VAGNVVTAWVLTLPLSAGMAVLLMLLFTAIGM